MNKDDSQHAIVTKARIETPLKKNATLPPRDGLLNRAAGPASRSDLVASLALHERKSLLASLHDGVSQQLFGLRMLSSQLAKVLRKECPEFAERAELIEEVTHDILKSVRGMMEGLAPYGDEPGDFLSQLLGFSARIEKIYGVRCVMQIHAARLSLHPEIGNQLCLIAQEAVMNAVKHAEASIIIVEVRDDADGSLAIRVADNGKGIDDAEDHIGFGLTIMQERAALIGASLDIGTREQGGTAVVCRWTDNPEK